MTSRRSVGEAPRCTTFLVFIRMSVCGPRSATNGALVTATQGGIGLATQRQRKITGFW